VSVKQFWVSLGSFLAFEKTTNPVCSLSKAVSTVPVKKEQISPVPLPLLHFPYLPGSLRVAASFWAAVSALPASESGRESLEPFSSAPCR
jgi:hypothetical protein